MKCRLLTVATALLASALPAFAAGASSAPVVEHKEINLIQFIQSGGPVMYVLFLLSVVMVALALTLMLSIRRGAVVTDRFMGSMESMVRSGDIQGLSAYARRYNHRMAAIVQHTADFIIQTPQAGIEEVRELVQSEGSRQVTQLTAKVTYLADIGAIAPLVGLLGTVMGMTQSFFELSAGDTGVKQLQLSSGISHALITTAGGLVVAVPALVLYALFRGRALKLASELEATATHFILELQMYSNRVRQHHARNQQVHPSHQHHAPQQHQPMGPPSTLGQDQPGAWSPAPGSLSPNDLRGI